MLLRTAGQGVLEPVWGELLTLELPLLAVAGARDEGYSAAARRMAETAPRRPGGVRGRSRARAAAPAARRAGRR